MTIGEILKQYELLVAKVRPTEKGVLNQNRVDCPDGVWHSRKLNLNNLKPNHYTTLNHVINLMYIYKINENYWERVLYRFGYNESLLGMDLIPSEDYIQSYEDSMGNYWNENMGTEFPYGYSTANLVKHFIEW